MTEHPETTAITAGRSYPTSSLSPPLFPSTTYEMESIDAARTAAHTPRVDTFYGRYGNPTVTAFEDAVAALEGAEAAQAFASGMGAVTTVVLALCSTGDHVVAQRQLYSHSAILFQAVCPRFGIEVSLAALVSPPHLLLMLALGMIVTGPLRAAWKRAGKRAPWTAVISATLLLSMFTFFDQFDQPLVNVWAAGQVFFPDTLRYTEELGILGIMVQTALLTGVVLYLLSRFTLPFGSITLLAGLNGILLGSLAENFNLIPVAILGGLLADLVMLWLRPGPRRITALRLAAVIGPVGVSSLYLLAVQLTQGIAWPVTLWLGSIVVSGAIGLLLSYLAVQPPAPQPD